MAVYPWRRLSPGIRMGIVVTAMGLLLTAQEGRSTREGQALSLFELQDWARRNTSPDSLFLMSDRPWRGISERRVIFTDVTSINFNAYNRDKRPQLRNKEIHAAFTRTGSGPWDNWTERQVLALAAELGGTHIVRGPQAPALNLPEIFRNESGAIYDVRAASSTK